MDVKKEGKVMGIAKEIEDLQSKAAKVCSYLFIHVHLAH